MEYQGVPNGSTLKDRIPVREWFACNADFTKFYYYLEGKSVILYIIWVFHHQMGPSVSVGGSAQPDSDYI
jgi:hypothetical protein